MKKLTSLAIIIFSFSSLFAQYDRKAKNLLDEVSAKTKTYSTISANFKFTHQNLQEKINKESEGIFELKSNKYRLQFQGNTVYCNGATIWSVLAQNKEINISEVDEEDNSIFNPTKMLTMYEKGFKYKFIQERFEAGRAIGVIDLYPENIADSEYSKVRLEIDKDKKQLVSIQYFSKDENRFIIKIDSFKTGEALADDIFTFEKTEFPAEYEIIDLR